MTTGVAQEHSQNQDSQDRMIFVHSYLDLYFLDPYEFRVFAHIARRGKCYSNLERMALICDMSVRKVQNVLKKLDKLGLISGLKRPGKTTIYQETSFAQWKQPQELSLSEAEKRQISEGIINSIEFERTRAFKQLTQQQENLSSLNTEQQKPRVIFIHGYLDLYHLNPYQFRLIAHIARWKECSDTLREIAFITRMGFRKAQDSLGELTKLGILLKTTNRGKPTTYKLAHFSNWKPPEEIKELEKERSKVKAAMQKKEARDHPDKFYPPNPL